MVWHYLPYLITRSVGGNIFKYCLGSLVNWRIFTLSPRKPEYVAGKWFTSAHKLLTIQDSHHLDLQISYYIKLLIVTIKLFGIIIVYVNISIRLINVYIVV